MKWSLGCDPEIFAVDKKNKPVPIFGLIGGTKENPLPYGTGRNQLFYQEDGAALEFNTPVAYSSEHFHQHVINGITMCKTLLGNAGLKAKIQPQIAFTDEQLHHPSANTIGCVADVSAYRDDGENGPQEREPFTSGQMGNLRFAGGHVHIGYNKAGVPPWVAARYADVFVGMPSLRFDKQQDRRKFYGDAGLFREKPYGIEYRTLSPIWLRNRERIQALSFCLQSLGQSLNSPEMLAEHWDNINWKEIRRVIKEEDVEKAKDIMISLRATLPNYDNSIHLMFQNEADAEHDA